MVSVKQKTTESALLGALSARKQRMPRPGDLKVIDCPSREVLKHLTSLWGTLALLALREQGTLRFGALRRQVPSVSEKMLAQTLQALEGDGLVRRVAHAVVPPHVDYSLTPLGQEAVEPLMNLTNWVEHNLHRVMDARRAR